MINLAASFKGTTHQTIDVGSKTTLKSLLVTGYIWYYVLLFHTPPFQRVSRWILLGTLSFCPFVLFHQSSLHWEATQCHMQSKPDLENITEIHQMMGFSGIHSLVFRGVRFDEDFWHVGFRCNFQTFRKLQINPPVTYCSITSKNQLSILWICQPQNDYRLEHEPLDFWNEKTREPKNIWVVYKLIFRISPFKIEYTW